MCSQAHTGDRAEETTGHFRTDASRSVVVLHIRFRGPEQEDDGPGVVNEYDTYVLVPRTTLAAQIHAAECSASRQRERDGDDTSSGSEDTLVTPLADQPEPPSQMPPCVPWANWGPRGCLRLRLPQAYQREAVVGQLGEAVEVGEEVVQVQAQLVHP